MGKVFYGTHADKITAMRLANQGARSYRKGVCWTPAKDSTCKYDSAKKLWTCKAAAHHHEGSCGTWEIHHQGSGTPWQLGYTCDANGCRPYIGGELIEENKTTAEKIVEIEEYTDALPEDYEFLTQDI